MNRYFLSQILLVWVYEKLVTNVSLEIDELFSVDVAVNFNNSNRQVGSLIYWRNFLFKHSEVSYRDTWSWRIYVDGIRWNFQVRACLAEGKPRGIRKNGTLKHTYVYRFMIYEIVSTWISFSLSRYRKRSG